MRSKKTIAFKWRHFHWEVISMCRWYCKYGISYRDLDERIEAININRGLLPIRITATQKETSALREFKEQLKTLKEDMAFVISMAL